MNNTKKIALCGMLCALAVVALLLGSLTGIGVYAGPLLAMVVLLPVLEEYGGGAAIAAWVAVSALSLLLVPDRELCLVYMLLGWYPAVRRHLNRLPGRILPAVAKLVIYAAAMALLYGLLMGLMGLDAGFASASRWYVALLFVCGGAVFLFADRTLDRMLELWRTRLRRRLIK